MAANNADGDTNDRIRTPRRGKSPGAKKRPGSLTLEDLMPEDSAADMGVAASAAQASSFAGAAVPSAASTPRGFNGGGNDVNVDIKYLLEAVKAQHQTMQRQQEMMVMILENLHQRPPQQNQLNQHIEHRYEVQRSASAETSKGSLPVELSKQLKKVRHEYTDCVRKFMNAKKRFRTSEGIYNHFKEQSNVDVNNPMKNSYPSNVKPFASAPTFAELDEPFSGTLTAPCHVNLDMPVFRDVQITIPMGATRRAAMATLHYAMSRGLKFIEHEAHTEKRDNAKAKASQQKLKDAIVTLVRDAADANKAEKLGLDAPLRANIPDGPIDKHVTAIYKSAVECVTKEIEEQEAKQKSVDEDNKKTKRDLLKADPENLMNSTVKKAVDTALDERLGAQHTADAAMGDNVEGSDENPCTLLVEALTKPAPKAKSKGKTSQDQPENASSPESVLGQNTGARLPKGVSKGKSFDGKGKGKHKGKRKGVSKGIGSGKGKNQEAGGQRKSGLGAKNGGNKGGRKPAKGKC